ncbi:MAG: fibronectin type III domain-containing protein [Muribaculaceae bacterium]|nr:fibronectin type III domain-containing protein [Muribaculaceae bacterium]
MVNFKYSLLAAAVVAGLSATAVNADRLTECSNSSQKIVSTLRADLLSANKSEKITPKRKALKKFKSKPSRRHAPSVFTKDVTEEAIYDCSFAFLTEGSETEPAAIELDDWDNIPEEIIGEENYGFGGQGIMQAGGSVYVPFEYIEDPDDDFAWEMEGMLWTPDVYEPMTAVIELDAKIVNSDEYPTEELWIYASDYSDLLDNNYKEIGADWTHVTITLDCTSFVPESEDDSYYFTIFADNGADIVIKNVVIKGEKAPVSIPVAQDYTDYTGTSFTANWSAVENATGYYLTVYNFDIDTKKVTTTFLDKQFTAETSYTVTGLTPGNFYAYNVCATDGSYTSAASNTILVCELASPTNVTITPSDDNKSLNFSWEPSAGANYYVLTAASTQNVTSGQTVTLVNADFSSITSNGTVANPEESDYWYESVDELPGWRFNLGCMAEGAFGFMDNAYYTAMTGLTASLGSMDYDLSNIKDGKVNVSIEAASPGNGMLAGLLAFNPDEEKYDVGSAYGTPGVVPEDYETYNFSLTGATDKTQFLFVTNSVDGSDGALLIRTLKITAEAAADGKVGIPVGTVETADTQGVLTKEIEKGVTYTASVVPYFVDDEGYILAAGQPSETATYTADENGVESVAADADETSAHYFNLQGQPVENPAKGSVVIKVTNKGASKIIF